MKRHSLCILLIIALTLLFAMPVCAEEDWTGYTPISTPEDLDNIRNDLSGKYYLTNDIIFTDEDFAEGGAFYNNGNGWSCIGSESNPFCGILDGNGYTIDGLYMTAKGSIYSKYFGLFSRNDGIIRNLGIINSVFIGDTNSRIGAFCGQNTEIIENCYNTSKVSGAGTSGGVAGENCYIIRNCYNEGNIVSEDVYTNYHTSYSGGICGELRKQYSETETVAEVATIRNCYNSGKIESDGTAGGICGNYLIFQEGSVIKDCYNIGYITAYGNVGGIVGESSKGKDSNAKGTLENCYSFGTYWGYNKFCKLGAIVGYTRYALIVKNCYYNDSSLGTSGNSDSSPDTKATYLSSSQLSDPTNYIGFNFQHVWYIDEEGDYTYPQLYVFSDKQPEGAPIISDISISPASKGLIPLEEYQLECTVEPNDYSILSLEWKSSNPSVATVTNTGQITAIKPGTTTISVKSLNSDCRDEINITVYKSPEKVTFTDVKSYDWFYPYVDYVTKFGLFNGVGNNKFAPNNTMTRAMVVTVLYRMENSPSISGENPFTDVENGTWYTDAVIWAYENGIVNGMGEGLYAPNSNVIREQFAAILYRYAEGKGFDTSKKADISAFPDDDQIFDYAKDPFRWAYGTGIINGKAKAGVNYLAPKDYTTRAEVAKMISKLITTQHHMGTAKQISLWQDNYELAVGSSLGISSYITPLTALEEATWTSSNPTVATVSNGLIKGISVGSATITVKLPNGEYDTCTVKIVSNYDYCFNILSKYIIENGNRTYNYDMYQLTFHDSEDDGYINMAYYPFEDIFRIRYSYSGGTAAYFTSQIEIRRSGSPYYLFTKFTYNSHEIFADTWIYANSYNTTTKLNLGNYTGSSSQKSNFNELSDFTTEKLIYGLDTIFAQENLGISMADFGFTNLY